MLGFFFFFVTSVFIKKQVVRHVCVHELTQPRYLSIFLGLTVRARQNISLSQALGETAISPQTVQEMYWYIILPDGRELKIAYCNSTMCSLLQCDKSCPACLPRLKADGMALILRDVRQDDNELRFKCRIEPKMRAKSVSDGPQVYKLKIKIVSEPTAG